jgi:hypothetical protein
MHARACRYVPDSAVGCLASQPGLENNNCSSEHQQRDLFPSAHASTAANGVMGVMAGRGSVDLGSSAMVTASAAELAGWAGSSMATVTPQPAFMTETWMILEYADKGVLQVGAWVGRGHLAGRPAGPAGTRFCTDPLLATPGRAVLLPCLCCSPSPPQSLPPARAHPPRPAGLHRPRLAAQRAVVRARRAQHGRGACDGCGDGVGAQLPARAGA